MINHELCVLFIHIPRTGGTSIEKQLFCNNNHGAKHWNLSKWKAKLSKEELTSLFKFSFVRNPWDIMISKYVSSYYNKSKGFGNIGFSSNKSLKYFLTLYKRAKNERGDTFFDFFDPTQLDFIGKYETRKTDLEFISQKINFNISPDVTCRRHPNKNHYTTYYDEETIEMVRQKYIREIEYFGYKFGE